MSVVDMLSQDERREIDATLASEIERMERVLGPFETPAEFSDASGWGEIATSDGGDGPSPATLLQTDGRYRALLEALRRLEDGTYGFCVHCRNPIPMGRLRVMPETDRCVGCGGHA